MITYLWIYCFSFTVYEISEVVIHIFKHIHFHFDILRVIMVGMFGFIRNSTNIFYFTSYMFNNVIYCGYFFKMIIFPLLVDSNLKLIQSNVAKTIFEEIFQVIFFIKKIICRWNSNPFKLKVKPCLRGQLGELILVWMINHFNCRCTIFLNCQNR